MGNETRFGTKNSENKFKNTAEGLSVNPHDMPHLYEKHPSDASDFGKFQQKPVCLQGWVCPKCGRVFSPYTSMCPYCGREDMFKVTC